MNLFVPLVGTMALIGSALVAGVFFAFSSFVIKALARLPTADGMAAMQSINVVVINRSFLGTFMGTAVLSLLVAGLAVSGWDHPSAILQLSGAILYLVGTVLVTVSGNVPLNDELAGTSPTDPSAAAIWKHFLARRLMWNHVRTAAATVAALFFALGLMQHGTA